MMDGSIDTVEPEEGDFFERGFGNRSNSPCAIDWVPESKAFQTNRREPDANGSGH